MKKVFAMMLAMTIGFGMVSCNSDDDDGVNTPQFTIHGIWKVTQIFINGVEHNVNDYCPYKGSFQFISGGTYVENGFELVESNCIASDPVGGTWTKNGNTYTLTLNAGATSSVLPNSFSPIVDSQNINMFELNLSAGGIPTRLVFTKQ